MIWPSSGDVTPEQTFEGAIRRSLEDAIDSPVLSTAPCNCHGATVDQ
jgi:hypothetical protein